MSETVTVSPLLRLEITQACERLALDYVHASDFQLRDQMGDQFAEDAEFHLWGKVFAGRSAIRDFLLGNDPDNVTMHSLSNFRLDVLSETEARGSVYVTAQVGKRHGKDPAPLTMVIRGVYKDIYRKIGGQWRIARRDFEDLLAPAPV